MGLVEAVGSEGLHLPENGFRGFSVKAPFRRAPEEACALPGHFLSLLLGHGAAQRVSLGSRVAGSGFGYLHDLFLIEDDAVGVPEAGFEGRVGIAHGRFPVAAPYEFLGHAGFEGAGTVEGEQGHDVAEALGPQECQVLPHPRAFHLEDTVRVSPGIETVDSGIIEGQRSEVRSRPALPGDGVDGVLDDGHVGEPQDIEFDKPGRFHHGAVELGDAFPVPAEHDRHAIGEGAAAHDHAGGVDAGLPHKPLDSEAHRKNPGRVFVLLCHVPELRSLADDIGDAAVMGEGRKERG